MRAPKEEGMTDWTSIPSVPSFELVAGLSGSLEEGVEGAREYPRMLIKNNKKAPRTRGIDHVALKWGTLSSGHVGRRCTWVQVRSSWGASRVYPARFGRKYPNIQTKSRGIGGALSNQVQNRADENAFQGQR